MDSPNNGISPVTENDCGDFLVGKTLFVGDLPSSIRDTYIKTLLQHCMPIEMYIRREDDLVDNDECSYLRFSRLDYADRAYTLYNGFKFANGAVLQLRMYMKPSIDPTPNGDILQVTGLAPTIDNNDRLYDVFRPFGPLKLCVSHGDGTAVIQYFHQPDSAKAIHERDGMLLHGSRILIESQSAEQEYPTTSGNTSRPLSPTQAASTTEGHNEQQQQQQYMYHPQHALVTPAKSTIDFLNLYVKNMDPLITNEHLHALFGKFGQIVSARVISHPTTKQSRGYGFVSFSTEDEAARAQEGMNGQVVFSKPLYVSFHEPKKNRTTNNTSNNNYNNTNTNTVDINTNNNNLTGYSYHHSDADENNRSDVQRDINSSMDSSFYQQQQHIVSPVVNLPRKQDLALEQCYPPTMMIEEVNPLQHNATIKLPRRKSQFADDSSFLPLNTIGSSLESLVQVDLSAYDKRQHMEQVTMNYNDFSAIETPSPIPRSSADSITSDPGKIQRQRLTKAVIRCGACHKERVPDIVDLLLSLSRKERSLCLFNADFLHEKVMLALDSLDTFDDDDDDEQVNSTYGHTTWDYSFETSPPRTSPIAQYKRATKTNVDYPLPATPPYSSLSTSDPPPTDIEALLTSLSSMSLMNQKQALGDVMWPYVKPLAKPLAKANRVPGFSSKVLVYLLDNVPLHDLAHGISNTAWLKTQIELATNKVS